MNNSWPTKSNTSTITIHIPFPHLQLQSGLLWIWCCCDYAGHLFAKDMENIRLKSYVCAANGKDHSVRKTLLGTSRTRSEAPSVLLLVHKEQRYITYNQNISKCIQVCSISFIIWRTRSYSIPLQTNNIDQMPQISTPRIKQIELIP